MNSPIKDVVSYFRYFRECLGRRVYALFVFTLFGALAESFGIVLFLPLLAGLDESGAVERSPVQSLLNEFLLYLGLNGSTVALLGLITVAFIGKGVMLFASLCYKSFLRATLLETLKKELYKNYRQMDFRHYASRSTGHFVDVINGQTAATLACFEGLVGVASQSVTAAAYFGLAVCIAQGFGFMALICGAVLLFAFRRLNVFVRHVSREAAKENGELAKLLVQAIQGFKYLTSTGQSGALETQISHSLERLTGFERNRGYAAALVSSCREPFAVVVVASIVGVQVVLLRQPLAPILVSILLLNRALNTVMLAQGLWVAALAKAGGLERVRDEFVEQAQNRRDDGGAASTEFREQLVFRNVSFRYGAEQRNVLDDVSISIPVNSSLALIGPSGAGKSTLVDLMTLLLRPSNGEVLIDGVNANYIDACSWQSQIGYVSQDAVIFDDSIANNIGMWAKECGTGADLDSEIEAAARKANIHEFIMTLPDGYQTQVGDRGVRLSGGQKQRLFIARELFRQPRLLILDEATSALDTESERCIQESIDSLMGEVTIIIVAHRLSTIQNADQVCVLDGGRIVECGTYQELRRESSSALSRLVEAQSVL